MSDYLDLNGLAHLKDKLDDTYTTETYVNNHHDSTKANQTDLTKTNIALVEVAVEAGERWSFVKQIAQTIGTFINFVERTYTKFRNLINEYAISTTLKEIDGRSVVINQLVKPNEGAYGEKGITLIDNGDGTYTLNGTATAIAWIRFVSDTPRKINVPVGHKCFFRINIENFTLDDNVYGRLVYEVDVTEQHYDKGQGAIAVSNITAVRNIVLRVAQGMTFNNNKCTPQLIDLTKFFGQGSEPSSLDDPKIEEVKRYLALHPEYNEGSIVSAEADKIVSKEKNIFNYQSQRYYAYLVSNAGTWYYSNDSYSYAIPCEPNKTYFIKYFGNITGSLLRVAYTNSVLDNVPYIGRGNVAPVVDIKVATTPKNGVSITTGNNAKYIILQCGGVIAINDLNKVQIEEGNAATSYVPYKQPIEIDIPQAIQELDGYGIRNNKVDYANKKYIQNDDIRAYQSGDENEPTYLTDGTNTIYPLTTPIETDISSYLPEYFGQFNVEGNGTITIHNDNELDTTSKFENMEVIQ